MSKEPLVSQFTGEIYAIVDKYRDQCLTISEALGALDLIHAGIIRDAMDQEDEPG